MNDDELFDNLVSMGNDPDDIEHEYTDEELLTTRPMSSSETVVEKKPKQESIVTAYAKDMAKHPLATTESLAEIAMPITNPVGWALPMADAIASLKDTQIGKYLPEVGSPYEFFRHMDENPGDWAHLLGFNQKMKDMAANPEDYAE